MDYFTTLVIYYHNNKSEFHRFDFNDKNESTFKHRVNALKKCFSLQKQYIDFDNDKIKEIKISSFFTYKKQETMIFENIVSAPRKFLMSKIGKTIIPDNLEIEIDIYNDNKWNYHGITLLRHRENTLILSIDEEIVNNLPLG